MVTSEEVEAGQAVYSPMVLWTYDWIVLGLSNRFLWRCPTSELLRLYDANIFSNGEDAVETLDAALRKRFRDVVVNVRGTVALFEAST